MGLSAVCWSSPPNNPSVGFLELMKYVRKLIWITLAVAMLLTKETGNIGFLAKLTIFTTNVAQSKEIQLYIISIHTPMYFCPFSVLE